MSELDCNEGLSITKVLLRCSFGQNIGCVYAVDDRLRQAKDRPNAELDALFRRDVSYDLPYVWKELGGVRSYFQALNRSGRDGELVVPLKIVEDVIRA